jgi:hypothetical protein
MAIPRPEGNGSMWRCPSSHVRLYHEAHAERVHRDRQLASQPLRLKAYAVAHGLIGVM